MNPSGEMRKRIEENLFFQRYRDLGVKENLFSDTISGVGHLQQQIVRLAYPEFIGRRIINVEPTKEAIERFPLAGKAVGYAYAEGVACRLSGDKTQSVVVNMNNYAECSEQWTMEFIEDASPNAVENIKQRIASALALDETEAVLNFYGCVADEDLAGGAALDQGDKVMDWNAVMKLHNAVKGENWKPSVLVLNNFQLSQLLLDNRFIEYEYLPSKGTDLEEGLIREILGMKVETSTLVPNGTAYAIDKDIAGIMLLRRDVMVEDWSDLREDKYGLRATTRFGLGILRSNAVARMTNIKTTLC
jgi:hypothetical protein